VQPDAGRIEAYTAPGGPGIRIDGHLASGNLISPHYDSMLTKVIAKGPNFKAALTKMDRGLQARPEWPTQSITLHHPGTAFATLR
jgi:pyruvate carboxylase